MVQVRFDIDDRSKTWMRVFGPTSGDLAGSSSLVKSSLKNLRYISGRPEFKFDKVYRLRLLLLCERFDCLLSVLALPRIREDCSADSSARRFGTGLLFS